MLVRGTHIEYARNSRNSSQPGNILDRKITESVHEIVSRVDPFDLSHSHSLRCVYICPFSIEAEIILLCSPNKLSVVAVQLVILRMCIDCPKQSRLEDLRLSEEFFAGLHHSIRPPPFICGLRGTDRRANSAILKLTTARIEFLIAHLDHNRAPGSGSIKWFKTDRTNSKGRRRNLTSVCV